MNITFFAGSLRKDSLNRKFVSAAKTLMTENQKITANFVSLKELQIPVYDGDIEAVGIPDGVKQLAAAITSADGLVISTPEYNGSIPGPFKNIIDWVSRIKPNPWAGKPILLLGASPGAFGAVRSLGISRLPLDLLGAYVFPQMMGLPKAHEAFTPTGDMSDEATKQRLAKLLAEFYDFAGKLSKPR